MSPLGTSGDNLLGSIVRGSQDAIVASDLRGRIISWNPAAETMFGYPQVEVMGSHVDTVLPIDTRCLQQDVLPRVHAGEYVAHYETQRLGKDGSRLAVSLTASPLQDQFGTMTGACMIIRDIEERIEAEATQEVTRVSLALSHQAIVHDLRGPVAMAGSLVRQAMEMDGQSAEDRTRVLELAARCVDQTITLLSDVSSLFQVCDTIDFLPLDLGELVREVADTIPGMNAEIGDLPDDVLAHRPTMMQMIRNLLENARRHAATPDGVPRVCISCSESETHWSIAFDDDGPGIDPEEIARVFEPYYRGATEEVRDGTGLGLAIVNAGAVAHGGGAYAENRPGGGLRVTVRIAR
ncbi:MAG: putative Histidine kinase [Thermoleophilia bacterium]|nr:putative Histidine kinase [Thermoleophilia bacterium]